MRQESETKIRRLSLAVHFSIADCGISYGSIQCEHLPFLLPFWGMGDLIGELDRLCDYLGFPQAWETRRRLCKQPKEQDVPAQIMQRWNEKTALAQALENREDSAAGVHFFIQIFCRQHSDLQGMLQFKGERIPFRSVLELLTLLNDALELETRVMQQRRIPASCLLQA